MPPSTDRPSLRRRVVRRAWTYRNEALVAAGVAATGGLALALPATRRLTARRLRHARTRRLLGAGFAELRLANAQGQTPRIRRIEEQPFGERVHLRARAGHWADLLEVRGPALAAAVRAVAVRVEKDDADSSKITLDVVRRDPLAQVGDIDWLGLAADELSIWDEIHLGTTEMGTDLYLSLIERSVLIGGIPGSGKSVFIRQIVTHAAKSPDAELLLIDPNRVQFAPWRHRALAYASSDPGDALAVLALARAEVDRRLDLLTSLPGCPDKVTRELAAEHDMPPWLLMIDELAFHTSVTGTGESRAVFAADLRDIVARGRAANVIVVAATQRPTDKVVPRELADLFAVRVAFSVATHGNSNVILGEGWAKRGYSAADIKLDQRGQGFVLAEGGKPVRFKAARIPGAVVADLSVTTARFCPRHPSVSAQTAATAAV